MQNEGPPAGEVDLPTSPQTSTNQHANRGQVGGIQSLSRAFAILGLVAAAEEPLGVSDIGRRAELPKTTAARLLLALSDLGALEKTAEATYRIGPAIGALVTGATGSTDLLRQMAWPHLHQLADELGEHAALAVADAGDVLYVAQVSSPSAVDPGDWTETRHPPHGTAFGHVLMTEWSPKRLERYLSGPLPAHTEATVVDAGTLRHRLAQIEEHGVAWTVDEFAEDITGVAAPVVDSNENVVAAVGVFAPSYRFPGDVPQHEINRLVRRCAADLSGNFQGA